MLGGDLRSLGPGEGLTGQLGNVKVNIAIENDDMTSRRDLRIH